MSVRITSAFDLEPPFREPNLITKGIVALTGGDDKRTKTARKVLWIMTFTCLGFALTSATAPFAATLFILSIPLLIVSLEAQRLYDDIMCREFNRDLIKIIGGQEAFSQIPCITVPEEGIEKIKADQMTQRVAKGMWDNTPFIAVKSEKDVDCYCRDLSYTWRRYVPETKESKPEEQEITIEQFRKIFTH